MLKMWKHQQLSYNPGRSWKDGLSTGQGHVGGWRLKEASELVAARDVSSGDICALAKCSLKPKSWLR